MADSLWAVPGRAISVSEISLAVIVHWQTLIKKWFYRDDGGKACVMVNAVCGITQGFVLWAENREEIQHDNHGKHFVFKKLLQL